MVLSIWQRVMRGGRSWDGETTAIQEFRGDFHLSQQRELSVGFGSEYAGVSFRRSETRLSGGLTPFHHPSLAFQAASAFAGSLHQRLSAFIRGEKGTPVAYLLWPFRVESRAGNPDLH
jgi:hypothetical protein